MDTKYIHHILPHPPFLWANPFPVVPTPRNDLLFPPGLHFLKRNNKLVIQGCFTWVLQVHIFWDFIKLRSSPLLLTHSLSPYSLNIQHLTIQCSMLYSYIDGLFQYFLFLIIFIFFLTSHSPNRWIH
jgi:hypothetical protein